MITHTYILIYMCTCIQKIVTNRYINMHKCTHTFIYIHIYIYIHNTWVVLQQQQQWQSHYFMFYFAGNTFAPGNLRATADNSAYRALVNYWIENKYTLRYSGGLVPDVYHILLKGQGVLSNASSLKAKVCMYVCICMYMYVCIHSVCLFLALLQSRNAMLCY